MSGAVASDRGWLWWVYVTGAARDMRRQDAATIDS